MIITRNNLKKLIESMLNEMPARQPGELDPSFYWVVKKFRMPAWEMDEYDGEYDSDLDIVHITGNMILPRWGDTEIAHLQMQRRVEGGCPHWEIKNVAVRGDRFYKNHKIKQPQTARDLGPMMYDIAMEIAGPEGLISDSGGSSDDAQRVWSFYLNVRNGVDIVAEDMNDLCGRSSDGNPAHAYRSKVYRKKEGSVSIIDALGNKIRWEM